ncbi:MAG: hypothetical protein Q4A06_09335 [Cardiobacteriaceae bacterium]|nr:hypothetical protein [Cardiobacteriaceae bacterium]
MQGITDKSGGNGMSAMQMTLQRSAQIIETPVMRALRQMQGQGKACQKIVAAWRQTLSQSQQTANCRIQLAFTLQGLPQTGNALLQALAQSLRKKIGGRSCGFFQYMPAGFDDFPVKLAMRDPQRAGKSGRENIRKAACKIRISHWQGMAAQLPRPLGNMPVNQSQQKIRPAFRHDIDDMMMRGDWAHTVPQHRIIGNKPLIQRNNGAAVSMPLRYVLCCWFSGKTHGYLA